MSPLDLDHDANAQEWIKGRPRLRAQHVPAAVFLVGDRRPQRPPVGPDLRPRPRDARPRAAGRRIAKFGYWTDPVVAAEEWAAIRAEVLALIGN